MKAIAIVTLITLITSAAHALDSEPVELSAFKALPHPEPTAVVPYGSAQAQAVDLFLPGGAGPFPVVILIHGGCWRDLPGAGREQLRHLGAELAKSGIAVWNIGYRRADEAGGGYPGTFEDVATAIDGLRSHASRYGLDLTRTVVVGHSAGGHLALWAVARDRLPATSALRRPEPLIPQAAISLAGVADVEALAPFVPVLCGPGIIEKLVGNAPTANAYADISPAALPPPSVKVVLFSAIVDRLVPPYVAFQYARAMRRKHGPAVDLIDIPGAGHFDLVTPGTAAWQSVKLRIAAALGVDLAARPR